MDIYHEKKYQSLYKHISIVLNECFISKVTILKQLIIYYFTQLKCALDLHLIKIWQ